MKANTLENVKNMAADRWHRKAHDGKSLADKYSGQAYAHLFYLHESAFVAGYEAAPRRRGRGRGRHDDTCD